MTNLPACCMDMDVRVTDLLFPNRFPPEGREFIQAHGILDAKLSDLMEGALDKGGGIVRIKHRCQHLADNGTCRIYNHRPAICRKFDCSTRSDCACRGRRWIPLAQVG